MHSPNVATHRPIIIVGAGPTGLTLASLLARYGVDVLVIAERFLETAATRIGKRIVGLTKAAAEVLLRHGWPGNVRELRNALDYAVAVARYDHIGDDDLPESVHPARKAQQAEESPASLWEDAERRHIEVVLRSVRGNRSQAALLLGIDRKTLHRKLDRFGIDIPARFRQRARADESGIIGEPFRLIRAGSA